MHRLTSGLMIAAMALTVSVLSPPALAGDIHNDVPEKVDPAKRYLIYIHGGWPEVRPITDPHPKHGLFDYEGVLAGLAERDFEVISELRREKTNPRRYARTRVIPQITALIEKGVPANQITVAGFSKGGNMVLVLSALAKLPELNLVTMAGCGAGLFRKAYDSVLANDAPRMQERMLSLYDQADTIAGSCEEAAKRATRLKMTEEELTVGAGHGTFYIAHAEWLDRIAAWAKAAGTSKK